MKWLNWSCMMELKQRRCATVKPAGGQKCAEDEGEVEEQKKWRGMDKGHCDSDESSRQEHSSISVCVSLSPSPPSVDLLWQQKPWLTWAAIQQIPKTKTCLNNRMRPARSNPFAHSDIKAWDCLHLRVRIVLIPLYVFIWRHAACLERESCLVLSVINQSDYSNNQIFVKALAASLSPACGWWAGKSHNVPQGTLFKIQGIFLFWNTSYLKKLQLIQKMYIQTY